MTAVEANGETGEQTSHQFGDNRRSRMKQKKGVTAYQHPNVTECLQLGDQNSQLIDKIALTGLKCEICSYDRYSG